MKLALLVDVVDDQKICQVYECSERAKCSRYKHIHELTILVLGKSF